MSDDSLSPLDVPGVDTVGVTAWFAGHVADARPPLHFDVIAGGHSNLTYRVTDADGRRFVLRRPPLGHRLASAHDMSREHRIIDALHHTAVPVPPAIGFCDDPTVNDQPFYVMGFVDGLVLRDRESTEAELSVTARSEACRSLVDTLAALHAVDLSACGLDTLGKHDGYIERQLKRWHGQWEQQKTRELPLIDDVHHVLSSQIPEQGPATIVHGDYRLDNCMVDRNGTVVAVLDWEICTLGDPLADLGLLQVYWTGPDDVASAWNGSATTAPGCWNRDRLARRYAEVTGRDLSRLPFYVAFAAWKLACILEGVYARYLGGALGARSAEELAPFEQQVRAAVQLAADTAAQL
jgi:aminoglycoside phosphotransferase (APT) family kinase protein